MTMCIIIYSLKKNFVFGKLTFFGSILCHLKIEINNLHGNCIHMCNIRYPVYYCTHYSFTRFHSFNYRTHREIDSHVHCICNILLLNYIKKGYEQSLTATKSHIFVHNCWSFITTKKQTSVVLFFKYTNIFSTFFVWQIKFKLRYTSLLIVSLGRTWTI